MKKLLLCCIVTLTIISCSSRLENHSESANATSKQLIRKEINENLPTIGILIFEGVIVNEVVAALDVFANSDSVGNALFNVIVIAKEDKIYSSANGLQIRPDYNISNVPNLKVLVVPSTYNTAALASDRAIVEFIQEQNTITDYMASHCSGAFLIGETGIADGKEIVTYVTGGKALKAAYPKLNVADDSKISVVQDGRFISSNGNLVSYLASFDLLENLTNKEHREFVEVSLLFNRLLENAYN